MKTKPITSIRGLARALKRNDRVIRGWLGDERWSFARKPPWSASELPAMDGWRLANLEQQTDGDIGVAEALEGLSAERKAKVRLVIERTSKIKLERELLAGKYLPRADAQADLLARAHEAKQTFTAIVGLAPRLVNRDEAAIRRMLDEHILLVCGIISNGGAQ